MLFSVSNSISYNKILVLIYFNNVISRQNYQDFESVVHKEYSRKRLSGEFKSSCKYYGNGSGKYN